MPQVKMIKDGAEAILEEGTSAYEAYLSAGWTIAGTHAHEPVETEEEAATRALAAQKAADEARQKADVDNAAAAEAAKLAKVQSEAERTAAENGTVKAATPAAQATK